nr:hypothetical protein [Tanacetum cinerariifolium]
MIVETLPSSTIPVGDNDSQREEIDIFTGTDELLPPDIESDDYDSEGDIHFIEELLVDDSILIPENELSDFDHQDDPSFPRPPPEPPDNEIFFEPDSGVLTTNMVQDTFMSDSEDSIITYNVVSSQFRGLSDIGSPGVDGPPVMPEDPYAYVVAAFQAPSSLDYVSGPEYPPSPEFVPEPVYLEFMPAEDDILPAEEQPLPIAASPTTESPRYIDEFDPEEDPVDYPANGGD